MTKELYLLKAFRGAISEQGEEVVTCYFILKKLLLKRMTVKSYQKRIAMKLKRCPSRRRRTLLLHSNLCWMRFPLNLETVMVSYPHQYTFVGAIWNFTTW
jgi:hypothetical protein